MAWAMQCPFWRWAKDGVSVCEGCRLTFVEAQEESEFFSRYCASPEGWRACTIARMLELSYERDIRK